jgi:hypothetical protein
MRWSWILLALAIGGCVTGVVDSKKQQQPPRCADPLRGSRYAMCARLSTAGLDLAVVDDKRLAGAVDATHDSVSSSRYVLRGGTFHAHR